jgi:hypothetical protein
MTGTPVCRSTRDARVAAVTRQWSQAAGFTRRSAPSTPVTFTIPSPELSWVHSITVFRRPFPTRTRSPVQLHSAGNHSRMRHISKERAVV